MQDFFQTIIFGIVCYLGIIVGSILSFIAPEEIFFWKKTYEFLARIIFLIIATITIHFLIQGIIIKVLVYALLIFLLTLRTKTFLKILIYILPILLLITLIFGNLYIVRDINIILIFLNLMFFGLLESYFLIPNVFQKNIKYLKKKEMLSIIKKTGKYYIFMNLLNVIFFNIIRFLI
jgi:hypothetical protein